jgi:hypothetical protein
MLKDIIKCSPYWLPVLFIIYPRNYALNLDLYSDLLSAALAYLAIFLFLKRKYSLAVLSGLVMALANFVRPEGLIFILPLLIYSIIKRIQPIRVIIFCSALLAGILLVGLFNYSNSGHFLSQSVTGGYNLLVGANPDANGKGEAYQIVLQPGKIGYISHRSQVSYIEKDRYWQRQAVDWIVHHPLEYSFLFIKKIYYAYYLDSWGINKLVNTNLESGRIHELAPSRRFFWLFVQILNQLVYMGIILLAILSFRDLKRKKEAWLFYLIIVFGSVFIGLLVGDTRMKYPLMPAFLVLASYSTGSMLDRFSRKLRKSSVGLDR